MIVVSDYVSEYCIWLALRSGFEQLTRDGQLPFAVVDLNTTGIIVTGMSYHFSHYRTINVDSLSVEPT